MTSPALLEETVQSLEIFAPDRRQNGTNRESRKRAKADPGGASARGEWG